MTLGGDKLCQKRRDKENRIKRWMFIFFFHVVKNVYNKERVYIYNKKELCNKKI